MNEETATEGTGRVRAEVSKRSFLNKDGKYYPRASTDSVGARVELLETGEVIEFSLEDFNQGVLNAAALFGIVTSCTNTFGGKGLTGDERLALFIDRLEALKEGEWTSERQSGPRTSQLLEAIVQVVTEAGKNVDQEWRDRKALELKDPEAVKRFSANPQVAAKLAAIKAAAATERAAKLAAKATGSATEDGLFD